MKPSETLAAARARLMDPARWCQGTEFRNAVGEPCVREAAVQCCAFGALAIATDGASAKPGDFSDAWTILADASDRLFGAAPDEVNDGLNHGAVLLMFDQAIADAKGGGK